MAVHAGCSLLNIWTQMVHTARTHAKCLHTFSRSYWQTLASMLCTYSYTDVCVCVNSCLSTNTQTWLAHGCFQNPFKLHPQCVKSYIWSAAQLKEQTNARFLSQIWSHGGVCVSQPRIRSFSWEICTRSFNMSGS